MEGSPRATPTSTASSPSLLPAPVVFTSLLDPIPPLPPTNAQAREAGLGFCCSGPGPVKADTLCFSRGDGEFSDCEVTLAGCNYRLHRQLLAKGPRRCGFFEGAFRQGGLREAQKADTTLDLTELLPEACHRHFATALDFVYGQDIEFTAETAAFLYKIGDVLQGESLMRASVAAMEQLYNEKPGWRTAARFLEEGIVLECEGIVGTFLPRVVRVGMPRDASERLLASACQRFPSLAALLLADLSEGSGWRWDVNSLCVRPADSCSVSHAQATFLAEGAARLLPDIEGVRTCAIVAVGTKCSGPTIGVSTAMCDLLSQRHADGGFARTPGGWGLSLTSGSLWAEGRRVGQVPPEFRHTLVLSRISMRLDPKNCTLTFSAPGWSVVIQADGEFGFGPNIGLRFTAYACCGGTAYALA